MAVFEYSSKITTKPDITAMYDPSELNRCKVHGIRPKVYEVYTGKRRKFQGATVECGHDDCLCFSYSAKDSIQKWNKNNPK
jgi:hypothetical protein